MCKDCPSSIPHATWTEPAPPINFGSGPGGDGGGYSWSGTTTKTFESGAQREALEHEFRFDLISPFALGRLAETYAEGAMKYDDHNWRKGMPFSSLLNHLLYHINLYSQGDRSEDHLAHAAWGLFAMMEFEVTDPAQNDLYFNDTEAPAEVPDPSYHPDYSGHSEDCTCRPSGTQLTQEMLDKHPVWSEHR